MHRVIALSILLLLAATPTEAETLVAQNAAPEESVSNDQAVASLRSAIERSLTDSGSEVLEVDTRNGTISARLVNSNMNEAAVSEREGLAMAIASVVSTEIAGKAEFSTTLTLRVVFLKRHGGTDQIVDVIEFREDPNGLFKHHRT